MTFELRESGNVIIVAVEGQVRILTQSEFKEYMDMLYEKYGNGTVLLDMQKVSYMNSAAIGIIVDTFRRFRDNDGRLILSGLTPEIAKLFEVTKLNRFIEIYADVGEAEAKLVNQ
jgi:anti-anti-sigma factor